MRFVDIQYDERFSWPFLLGGLYTVRERYHILALSLHGTTVDGKVYMKRELRLFRPEAKIL